jgi:hypothetical protein
VGSPDLEISRFQIWQLRRPSTLSRCKHELSLCLPCTLVARICAVLSEPLAEPPLPPSSLDHQL